MAYLHLFVCSNKVRVFSTHTTSCPSAWTEYGLSVFFCRAIPRSPLFLSLYKTHAGLVLRHSTLSQSDKALRSTILSSV